MPNDSKISVLPGNKGKDVFADEVAKLRANVPFITEHLIIMTGLHRAKYKALVAEGFTANEALELSKTVF